MIARLVMVLMVLAAAARAEEPLRVGLTELPPNRGNPFSSIYTPAIWTLSPQFDGLTHLTDDGRLIPWLATAWRATSTTTWEFTLREGVTFSNGEPFDAAAVAATVNFLAAPEQAGLALARELATLKSARVIGPLTVEITTDTPNPMLPNEASWLFIPAPKAWAELGPEAFAAAPVGTGPYRQTSWRAGRAEFDAVPSAWRKPVARRVVFIQVPESSARLQAVLSGQLDVSTEVTPDEGDTLAAAGGRLVPIGLSGVWAMVMNNVKTDSPFRDVRVRRALNLAVNRQNIIDVLLAGATKPASQPAPRGADGYNPDLPPFPYAPDEARRLLAEAGYPNGFKFVMESGSGAGSRNSLVSQQVAADLAAVGVTMEIRSVPVSLILTKMQNGGWEGTAFTLSFFTPTQDALRPMRNQSCLWVHPWYCDPEAMPLITQALAEFDLDKRRALVRQVMAHSHHQAQALFLYDGVGFMGLGRRVAELPSDISYLRFDALKWRE
jgi:peptide/nickel transport system substrate-binding protein